jgi:hypothetical protein
MKPTDPQFLYMVLILPSMFGLTLVGEGIYKLTQERMVGWFNIFMGVIFLVVVIVAFFMLSGMF